MNAWNHLPNAKLIDQVLAELEAHPYVFARARGAAWDAARDAARDAAYNAAWDAARDAARDAAYNAAWDAAWAAAWDAAWAAAWDAACSAIFALIAYDDADKYLSMAYDQLRIWAELSEHPAAVLLLSYVWVKNQITLGVVA